MLQVFFSSLENPDYPWLAATSAEQNDELVPEATPTPVAVFVVIVLPRDDVAAPSFAGLAVDVVVPVPLRSVDDADLVSVEIRSFDDADVVPVEIRPVDDAVVVAERLAACVVVAERLAVCVVVAFMLSLEPGPALTTLLNL